MPQGWEVSGTPALPLEMCSLRDEGIGVSASFVQFGDAPSMVSQALREWGAISHKWPEAQNAVLSHLWAQGHACGPDWDSLASYTTVVFFTLSTVLGMLCEISSTTYKISFVFGGVVTAGRWQGSEHLHGWWLSCGQ
jgi:hypothetical protein